MRRADALIACDRAILRAYSRETSRALQARLALGVPLPWLDHFLDFNLGKEIAKDAEVIRHAAQRRPDQPPVDPATLATLLARARAIDHAFLRDIAPLPVEIAIPYAAIEPFRAERITALLTLSDTLLSRWTPGQRLRPLLAANLPGPALEAWLRRWLHLYAEETYAIAQSLSLPVLLRPLREALAQGLHETMLAAADTLAARVGAKVRHR